MTWDEELIRITAVAYAHGVDPLFIAAIRRHENGPSAAERKPDGTPAHPFGEFGCPTAGAPDYMSQLSMCVKTVRNRLIEHEFPFWPIIVQAQVPYRRLAYTKLFVEQLAKSYCPVGARNDPTGLNQNWPASVYGIYLLYVTSGRYELEAAAI